MKYVVRGVGLAGNTSLYIVHTDDNTADRLTLDYTKWKGVKAAFPVNGDSPEEAKRLALDLVDYLNMRQEAIDKAVKEITITSAVAQKLTQ